MKPPTPEILEAQAAPSKTNSRLRTRRIRCLLYGLMLVFVTGSIVCLILRFVWTHSTSTHTTSSNNGSNVTSTIPPLNSTTNSSTAYWQPPVGTSWQLVLKNPLTDSTTSGIQVWDIDLFDNNASIISGLQANEAKVICYFSAGSYEDWRPDASNFTSADLGIDLDGWPGEKWVNTSSPNIRNIMLARLDLAVSKKCDGVDPDNVDAYDNPDNGLGLTQADAIDYVGFLAGAAHARNLSIGLKNAGDIIPNVLPLMQWSVNEQCEAFNECDTYAPFVQQGKPVFHVEYPKGDDTNNNDNVSEATKDKICDDQTAQNFSTIIKNMDLDLWIESC